MFEQKTIGVTEKELNSQSGSGLKEQEAILRLKENGSNELAQVKPKSPATMFLEQLNDPLIFVLFVAAAVSMLLREISDTAIIVVVILVNAIVGVIQEGKAQKALEALKKLTSPTALVKRGGVLKEIKAKDLVVGDVVCLEAGRQVPADLRLTETANLKIDEAALTGESTPVDKNAAFTATKTLPIGDCKNMAYMTSNVIYGRGEGMVVATGMNTEIGKIAAMIHETPQEMTPLQKRLADLGKILSVVAVAICAGLFAIALFQNRNVLEMLITAISLAVAAVPEGLPAIVTIVLALSVSRMVKVNTIIRRLPSVETLGSVSIVCTDKTGTLTQNKMTVVRCYSDLKMIDVGMLDYSKNKDFIHGFTLCNDAVISGKNRIGDPTELALVDMANMLLIDKQQLEKEKPRIQEIPFDSKRKMMTTVHREDYRTISYTKGSCDEIIKRCTSILINQKTYPMTAQQRTEILKAMEEMAGQALRVLALAMYPEAKKPMEDQLTFVGLVGMIDPPRPEVEGAIKLFNNASVRTVMITGDHVDTAFAIANKLGIAKRKDECISGEEIYKMTDSELAERALNLTVFARVSPEHKVRIVKAYKASGKIVAMTGDGVNDAPALKTADIGIAMGLNGTDVAKNASDMILTDDNFATIEKAIEEGRSIYQNIKKAVLFLLSSNFGEIITMFISILLGLASPLKASHILWINLITDSLPALSLGVDENDNKMLMDKAPRKPKESLFDDGGLFCTLFYGTLIAAISLVAFLTIPYVTINAEGIPFTVENIMVVLNTGNVLARSQTYAFTVLGLSQLFHAIGMRNVEKSIFRMNHLSNKLMIAAFFIGILLQISVTEIPYLINLFGTVKLSLGEWGRLIILSAMPLLAHEVMCLGVTRKNDKIVEIKRAS